MSSLKKRFYMPMALMLCAVGAMIWTTFGADAPRAQAAPPGNSTWNLKFEDNFDGTALDSNKWVTCWFWAGPDGGCINEGNPQQSYVLPKNVSVNNGALHLKTVKESYTPQGGTKTYNWTSGMVTTGRIGEDTSQPSKFAFLYGYMEIRAKLSAGNGIYNAFWTGPDDHGWPPEIDAFEISGDRPTVDHMTYHWNDSSGNHQYSSQEYYGPNYTQDWHTFGVDWQPGLAIWYVDGREITRSTIASGISAEKMHLLLAAEVWGASAWTSGPDANTPTSTSFDIDYVRVWQREGNVSNPPPAPAKINPVASFGTGGNGTSTYDKASDGDTTTAFDASAATDCYTGIDAGGDYTVNTIRYWPRLYAGSRMKGGQFQASSSQSGPWTTLYTVPGAPGDGVFTTASINNSTAYRYYRYVGPTDGHCNIMEMEFRY